MSGSKALRSKGSSARTTPKTPTRSVKVGGDGVDVSVEDFGVAIVGNGYPTKSDITTPPKLKGHAKSGLWGAAIAGDNAHATAAKDCVALSGDSGQASVGDGGMARASNGGFADAYWHSIARVDDNAWAISYRHGIAVARIGLAETIENGIAGAFAGPSANGGNRGISIAGPAGIAIAFNEGVLVQAGAGGALAGYWRAPDDTVRLAVQAIDPAGSCRPNKLYRFEGGKFLELTEAEVAQGRRDIERWKEPWGQSFEQVASGWRDRG